MPRRVTLPGADELFRTTGGAALQAPQSRQQPQQQHSGGEPQGDTRPRPAQEQTGGAAGGEQDTAGEERGGTQGRDPGHGQGRDRDRDDRDRQGGQDRTGHGGSAEHAGRDVPPARRPAGGAGGPGTVNGTAGAAPPQAPVQQSAAAQHPAPPAAQGAAGPAARRKAPRQNRRPSGRERHDEKITVYVSAEELMDLEHARLVLRGEHGLAIDRGRIVREAVAVVLADLESRGDASILVRRLRGR
ncbi:hypothetical protein [Streptomyces sp. NPDC020983]|uniref:hypothetical protein n=1 Tax=Streptomyces sp. NPDC020983 TaxID=3365106 RepID=UPI00379218D3